MYATTTKERLQKYAKHKFGEYKIMEERCGLTHGILSYPSEPNVRVLQKVLQKCPDLSADWLILGTGTMQREYERKPLTLTEQKVSEVEDAFNGKTANNSTEDMITIPNRLLVSLQEQLTQKDKQIDNLLQLLHKQ